MWIMAKRNHVNVRTGQKVITEGKQYQVVGYKKRDGYTVRNDNGKIGFYAKDIFQVMEQEPSCSYSFFAAPKNGSEVFCKWERDSADWKFVNYFTIAGGNGADGQLFMLLRFLRPL